MSPWQQYLNPLFNHVARNTYHVTFEMVIVLDTSTELWYTAHCALYTLSRLKRHRQFVVGEVKSLLHHDHMHIEITDWADWECFSRVCIASEYARTVFRAFLKRFWSVFRGFAKRPKTCGAFFDRFWSVFGGFAVRPRACGTFSERFGVGAGT